MQRLRAIFWDIVANLGGLAGLIALSYPVFSLVFRPEVNANPDLHQLVVFTCWILGIAFAGVLVLTVVQWRKIRDIRDTEFLHTKIFDLTQQERSVATIVHNLTHDVRNQILNLFFARDAFAKATEKEKAELIERIERNWGMFNLYYLDNLKILFDLLTRKSNSVCLKMVRTEIVTSQPEPRTAENNLPCSENVVKTIHTLYRDTMSYRFRRENDIRLAKYAATSNSAFARILSDDTTDYYYLCNDLSKEARYVNTNPRWREFYNATMVSPIRIENFADPSGKKSEKYITWGFICVDSLHGAYRPEVELELLQAFSDLYFPLLYSFDAWRKAVAVSQKKAEPEMQAQGGPEGHA